MQAGHKVFLTAALPAGIICFLVYLRSVNCGFVSWDDPAFVLKNLAIRQLDLNLIVWSFTTVPAFSGIWIPLTWISFAVDYHFWGLNPVGYHLTNILLHSANVALLVLIAAHLCRRVFLENCTPPWLVNAALISAGLFFGIHPLRVESVAWVTERKDVLNGLFTFGAILFYLLYVDRKDAVQQRSAARYYYASILCFLLSLMAKPVSVVLPVMLLVADWYPLDRLKKGDLRVVLLEKAPFFLTAAAVTLTTLYIASGSGGLLISRTNFPLFERVAVSGNALFEYLLLVLFPLGIVQYNPLPPQIPYSYMIKGLLAAVFIGMMLFSRSRILIATTLCFLLPLFPTLALFQANDHAYAARYTYLPAAIPSIAIAGFIVFAYRKAIGTRWECLKWIIVVVPTVCLLSYAVMTVKLIGVWKDTGTFWTRIIDVRPMGRAYQERGLFHFSRKEFDLAIADFSKAIEIAFGLGMYDRYNLNVFRGEAFRETGRYESAVEDFTYAISIAPRPVYYYHRGLSLRALGRLVEAEADFKRAGTEKGPIEWQ